MSNFTSSVFVYPSEAMKSLTHFIMRCLITLDITSEREETQFPKAFRVCQFYTKFLKYTDYERVVSACPQFLLQNSTLILAWWPCNV